MNKHATQYAIQCENLHYHAGFKPILSGVNLDIPKGAVVGLIGANGCGKSTLLRCLVGLLAPYEGVSSLLGVSSLALTDAIRERLGFVAQSPDLFQWMSVEKHLYTIGQAYPNWNEKRAYQLLIQLKLPLGKLVRQLSGGDQQKLAVVLALAHQPDIIILDEPVASLDPMTRRDFMRTLFEDGMPVFATQEVESGEEQQIPYAPTILLSSHILSDLERVVSHVAFMRNGRLQLFDEWDAVLEFVRVLPRDSLTHVAMSNFPRSAIIAENKAQLVVDTRHILDWNAKEYAHLTTSKSLSLDDLFIALNSD